MKPNQRIQYGILDVGNAVDRDHPLNRGRTAWWYTPPGLGAGSRLLDLMGRNHAFFAGRPTWLNASPVALSGSGGSSGLLFDGVDDSASALIGSLAFPRTFSAICIGTGPAITFYSPVSGGSVVYDSLSLGTVGGSLTWNYRNAGSVFSASGGLVKQGVNHIAGVATSSTNRIIYLNGEQVGVGSNGANSNIMTVFYIGRIFGGGNGHFNGTIFSSSYWSRALSAAEVAQDYRLSLQNYQTPDSPLRWLGTRSYFLPGGTSFKWYWQPNQSILGSGIL